VSERLTDRLLAGATGTHRARVVAAEPGVAAGIETAVTRDWPEPVGALRALVDDGAPLATDTPLLEATGTAATLAIAEDWILGDLGVACGVATNARRIRDAAPAALRIVCGGWKKLPAAMKGAVRDGLAAAGIDPRLLPGPFLYVDKNVAALLGGIAPAVAAGRALDVGPVSMQVADAHEAAAAADAGAGVVMVDTGRLDDLTAADAALRAAGRRGDVQLAFAGGVGADDLDAVAAAGAEIVDVGRAILGRPLLDLRFVVDARSDA
jgi:nicotinate-nucleotide pyrophosphorylase (carboxylating)